MLYKIKHIPTGLYYGPSNGRGSNLDKTGKTYRRVPGYFKFWYGVYLDNQSNLARIIPQDWRIETIVETKKQKQPLIVQQGPDNFREAGLYLIKWNNTIQLVKWKDTDEPAESTQWIKIPDNLFK